MAKRCLIKSGVSLMLLLAFCFFSCTKKEAGGGPLYKTYKRESLARFVYSRKTPTDTIKKLFNSFQESGNQEGLMITGFVLGQRMRDISLYPEAVSYHQAGLGAAIKLRDTLEIIQALNNIGTDHRRMGALSDASQYHYQALLLTEAYSEPLDSIQIKNRVISLNGIGNINRELKYYKEAERNFKEALEGERQLNSYLGMAINYANLGSIYAEMQEFDRARDYFLLSLEQNDRGNDSRGRGLCYGLLGDLYERQSKYRQAREQYVLSYQQLERLEDKWHWLGACIPMARISFLLKDEIAYADYIDKAERTALSIQSYSHLVEIYNLKHKYYSQKGNFKSAFEFLTKSKQLSDSLAAARNANSLQDLRINYERTKSIKEKEEILRMTEVQSTRSRIIIVITLIGLILFVFLAALLSFAFRQGRKHNQALRQIDAIRSDFFTGITHEFRTPITVIRGLNDRLTTVNTLSPEDKVMLHKAIQRQSDNLLELVNQLLDISKVKSGAALPEWRHGDIIPFVNMVMESFGYVAESQNIELIFSPASSDMEVDFVPSYLHKVISNLLSNAIKHTPSEGRVELSLHWGKQQNTFLLEVKDTGCGIAASELKSIFEAFYRSPSSSMLPGSGIGLSFTHLLVEAMKGTITVKSELGKGTTFTVVLPVANRYQNGDILPYIPSPNMEVISSQAPDVAKTNAMFSNENDATKPTILFVEDNRDIELLVRLLVSDRYNVVSASNGRDGLETAIRIVPDIIITDVMMPVMSGYEMIQKIKETIVINHIPIIVLTAKSTEQDRIDSLRLGIDAYMPKPFTPEELLLRIEQIISNRALLRDRYAKMIMKEERSDLPGEEGREDDSKENNLIEPLQEEQDTANDENMSFLVMVGGLISNEIKVNPDFSVQDLASRLCLSQSQLNRKLTSITGFSTQSYIQQIKIKRACSLLRKTDKSIADVSVMAGFNDPSYFSRIFKRYVGYTPSQYQHFYIDQNVKNRWNNDLEED